MDQKYCVGYSKNESGGSDQLHDRAWSRETGRRVKRNRTPGQAKQDALCLLIICSRLFFGFVNTLPHWSGGRKHSNWWVHRSVASQTASGETHNLFAILLPFPRKRIMRFCIMLHGACQWQPRKQDGSVRGQAAVVRERLLDTLSTCWRTPSARQSLPAHALGVRP